nr:hypothetical protein [Tanacetum cinerariifolium]
MLLQMMMSQKVKERRKKDFEDPEADSEETCKRIKKDRNGDDESDDNDGGGDGVGAQQIYPT